jgi:hypothetical protein
LAWLSAACAGLVLLTAVTQAWQQWDDKRLAEARLAVTKATAAAAGASAPEATAADRPTAASTAALAAALHRPWGRWFAVVESAAGRDVRWLGLEHDASGETFRLLGLAPDQATALNTTDSLAQSGAWQDVHLTRLQSATPGGGVRFEIDARVATSTTP